MSAHAVLPQAAGFAPEAVAVAFDGPADVFAHWRGSAMQFFAGAEFSVAEALATGMARGEVMHIPSDTEDRFDALDALVADGSVWKDKGGRLSRAVRTFESFLPLRRALVHGLARVEPLSDGGFVVRLSVIDPHGHPARETLFHDELENQLNALRQATRTLRDAISIHLATLTAVDPEAD